MSKKSLALCAVSLIFAFTAAGQPARITGRIDNTQRVTLRGHLRAQATAANDRGRVAPSLELSYVTLTLSQTAAQQADLAQLLTAQQTVGSAEYHRWLTPEQFADRFGVSQADLDTIRGWLAAQGLNVVATGRGRTWIAFDGMAAQVEAAFQLELHQYLVNGEMHFANASEPSVPAAFSGVVTGVRGLSDFRMKPRAALAKYTASNGAHYLAPDDIATIYDLTPLYSSGINGTGQTLVVAGQTTVNLSDIERFRSTFGLPANDPTLMLVPGSRSPGLSSSDLPEADLDLEWSGAIARQAKILFVYATDVMTAVQYSIDNNLAPVVSVSYGDCEQETPTSEMSAYQSWAQQGSAQGITWFAPAGDNGAADCGDTTNPGLAVDAPASVPLVTGVGGTEFAEGGGNYWAAQNTASGASVFSYLPETTWNDSAADGQPAATGGGASRFFSKPSWQTGLGVPADNARDVPDVALSASADHDGYLVYTGGSQQIYGGTSAPTPEFAGIATLLNQYLVTNGAQSAPGVGSMNPRLYAMAASTSDVFHDVTTGNNIVEVSCTARRGITCTGQPVGYTAHAGYNQSTGWGSVDVNHLITEWNGSSSVTQPAASAMTLVSNLTTVGSNDTLYAIATVTGANGATPTGVVTFTGNGSNLGTANLMGSAGTATATLAITGTELQSGSGTITASYGGGASTATASANVTVVPKTVAGGIPTVSAVTNAASYQTAFAPGGIMAVFGSTLAPSTDTATTTPLPVSLAGVAALVNGEVAPLYYVSSGLVNVQIPYETTPGPATVSINNNGQVTTQTFTVAATAPGIFIDQNSMVVPTNTASGGQEIAIYFTGAGAVSPAVSTGMAPVGASSADLPAPVNAVKVTVGGVGASVIYVGLTPDSVGVTQVNFTVPSGLAAGKQPVVVTVGNTQSAAAYLTITN